MTHENLRDLIYAHFGKKAYSINIIERQGLIFDALPEWKWKILDWIGVRDKFPPMCEVFIILNCGSDEVSDSKIRNFMDALECSRPAGLDIKVHVLGRNETICMDDLGAI